MTEWLHFHFSLSCIGEGNGNPLQCSCLESPRDWGAWWAAIYGVAQIRTRLKQLHSSSSSITTFTKNIIIYLGLEHFATCNWHHENKKHRKGHHNLHPVTDSQSLTPLARCSSVVVKKLLFSCHMLFLSHAYILTSPVSTHTPNCVCVCICAHVWLFVIPWTVAHHACLSMRFFKQKYWSGLSFPPPGNLPNPVSYISYIDRQILYHWEAHT